MKTLYESAVYDEIIKRIRALTPDSAAKWGKMNVSQMLAHNKVAFNVPLSEKKMPRSMLGLLVGWMIKSKLYDDNPWKKNLPTAPDFIIKDQRDFEKEKQELVSLVEKFYTLGAEKTGRFPHPMFGSFKPEQWGKLMYKHLDHHLQQFGV